MNWIYTNVLHNPRKALGISVLEYCVLDYIYKTQTHPEYGVNGWTKTGCHKIADFLGLSSGTVKGIFDRMDSAGLLERIGDDLKRATAKFYSIAYEQDVQKLNDGCSENEQVGVQKMNSKCSENEQYIKKEIKVLNKIEKKEPQTKIEETEILTTIHDQVDETAVKVVEIIPSKAKKIKYIYPPTQEELVQPIYEKLIAKKRDHPQIIDCWNWANHQAEAFWLHHDKTGWKIEKLGGAIATWINKAIQYKTVVVPCPIQYKNNPETIKSFQPIRNTEQKPELTIQDIEASNAHLKAVGDVFSKMGVRV